jgi:hypothetical protein
VLPPLVPLLLVPLLLQVRYTLLLSLPKSPFLMVCVSLQGKAVRARRARVVRLPRPPLPLPLRKQQQRVVLVPPLLLPPPPPLPPLPPLLPPLPPPVCLITSFWLSLS